MQDALLPGYSHRTLFPAFLLGLAGLLAACPPALAAGKNGEQIYRKQCAACHGVSGEGVEDKYPQSLAGKRSVAQLARYIARKMPEDKPGTCVGEDADKVAAYIYDAFYSVAAQARQQQPRIELSRLTVRQYRQVVTDLIGTFRSAGKPDSRQGLHAEYFKSRRSFGKAVLDRIDPTVKFDFGTNSPDPKIEAQNFSIRWAGSLEAPETGTYEFTLRTDQAARLWLNDPKRPLIDASVKSGKDVEHRASIFLLGGRPYPLRLEFSKAKQGVDDSKTNKKKPPPVKASIALEWKQPHQAAETVPARCLSPAQAPPLFVVQTAFPPDDRSMGYERGTSISRAWEQAVTSAAIETADYVVGHLNELASTRDGAADHEQAIRTFCHRFAERAFRRPLTDGQKKLYVDRQLERVRDRHLAVKRIILLVLQSPRFLYREVGGRPDAYDTAARLSFALWDSLPDNELLEAARSGRLATREQVTAQAERMVKDLRGRAKLRSFFWQWLKVDPAPELAKDSRQYPGFDLAVASDLRTSLELFLEDVLSSDSADFRQLLLAETIYLNGRLARLYGVTLPADAPFQKVSLEPGKRAGLLTHPYLLSAFAYTGSSSPIHRGVFLARNVLGQTLRPPPDAFTPLPAELHPNLTTRERVDLQTRPQNCRSCHDMINPLGFTLENFDAIGRFRDKEGGRPIDAAGGYQTRTGDSVAFSGPRDLALFLAASDESRDAFVAALFHYLVKQPTRAFGMHAPAELGQAFVAKQYNVRKLMVDIAATAALPRRDEPMVPTRRTQEK